MRVASPREFKPISSICIKQFASANIDPYASEHPCLLTKSSRFSQKHVISIHSSVQMLAIFKLLPLSRSSSAIIKSSGSHQNRLRPLHLNQPSRIVNFHLFSSPSSLSPTLARSSATNETRTHGHIFTLQLEQDLSSPLSRADFIFDTLRRKQFG